MKNTAKMPTSSVRTVRVLCYGRDQTLLKTRSKIIAWLGLEADTVNTAEGLSEIIDQTKSQYGLCVLCHTVPPKERPDLHAALKMRAIAVYQIEGFVEPLDFVAKVSELLLGSTALENQSKPFCSRMGWNSPQFRL